MTKLVIKSENLVPVMADFETEEKREMYEALLESGRERLLSYGPKKTNVADITEPVGVAKSTFYLYFESKADLYLEIFRREFEQLHDRVQDEIAGADGASEQLEALFRCYQEFAEENPYIQQMMAEENVNQMFRKNVSSERFDEVQQEGLGKFLPFIESIRTESDGLVSDVDPVTVMGVMSVIGLVVRNKPEFETYDPEYYEAIQDLLINALSRGLTITPD